MKLGDIVELVRGNTYKSKLLSETEGPVLLGLGSIGRNGGFKSGAWKHYPGASDQRILLHPGDLYVSLKDLTQACDLLGAVARVPDSVPVGRLTQDTVKLEFRCDTTQRDELYVYWSLRTPQYREYCRGRGTGTTNMSLSRSDFLAWELPKQCSWNDILIDLFEAIERLISVNQQTNDYLAELVTNRFLDQFGDLFSESGDSHLGDFMRLERGLSYKGKYLADQGVPMLNLGNIMPGSVFREEKLKYYTGEYKMSNKVTYHDILIANTDLTQAREVIGSAILVPRFDGDVIYSHHLTAVRDPTLPTYFLFEALKTPFFRSRAAGFATGTTVLALPKEAILDMPFELPNEKDVQEFEEWVTPLVLLQEENREQNTRLEQLRDALLPKLMSGEIDVSEVEKPTQPNNHLYV